MKSKLSKKERSALEKQNVLLKKRGNSFEVLTGSTPVLLSAPHNVQQIRNFKPKPCDLGTGHLLLAVQNDTNCFGIVKTNCVGLAGKINDDANYYTTHPYKAHILELAKHHNLKAVIDLHSLKKIRPHLINLGVNNGYNIQFNLDLLGQVVNIFNKYNFPVFIDEPFLAPENTVAGYTAKQTGLFCLQIEINSKLIRLTNASNQFILLKLAVSEIVNLLNQTF